MLAFVQKGNHAQSACTETVIVLLGRCDTVEVGGGFCVEQRKPLHFAELHTRMITNRLIPTVKCSEGARCSTS